MLFTFVVFSPFLVKVKTKNKAVLMCVPFVKIVVADGTLQRDNHFWLKLNYIFRYSNVFTFEISSFPVSRALASGPELSCWTENE